MKKYLFLVFIFFFVSSIHGQQAPYVPGLVVIKIDQQASKAGSSVALNEQMLLEDKQVRKVDKVISEEALKRRGAQSILSGIYKLDLQPGVNEEDYINYLKSFSNIKYAEPYPNVYPLFVPNDPQAKIGAAQNYLEQIKAYLAWDVTQGDASKVIGIIDTGVDLDHEDLQANLYLNTDDPIDGIDNDGDGYIDNYYGWDFADGDNNPEADTSPHGTGVTGIAAAATNNNTGMAGVGFNTKFMPIKIFRSGSNFSRNSYEGIIYAADQGCDVINLSWGNTAGYSQYAQDIIDYAVLEKDVVVVAAAGNTNDELNFFPASYNHVLSIGWVNSNDEKSPNATYSDFIDLVAPGVNIYTTENNSSYGTDGGSSYAAPMVAGAAALVRAVHPQWNALQVMEQLRVNSDDIYEVGNNADFRYKFGKGRLNIFKSLADYDDPAVRVSEVGYTNGLEQAAYFGDTLSITLEFANYLAATENVTITLASESPYVTLLDNSFTISSLGTLQKMSNANSPFRVILSQDLPENEAINFRVLMEGQFYSDYQSFQIQASPKTRIFDFNNWRFGFTATGNMGRSYGSPFSNYALSYKGVKLMEHLGLTLASAADTLSKNVAVVPKNFIYTEEFESFERLKRYNDITADLDIRSGFKEKDTLSVQQGVFVQQRLLGWESTAEEPVLLLKYQLMNRGNLDFDTLYFQLFADWAVGGGLNDRLEYDSATQMCYAYNPEEDNYIGLALLADYDSTFYALDITAENGNTSDLENDSLNNSLLWGFINNPFGKTGAGMNSSGNNVATLQGIRLNNFLQGDAAELTFALQTASSLQELKNLLEKAKTLNQSVAANPPLGQQVFICFNDAPQIAAPEKSSFIIYDSPLAAVSLYDGVLFEPGIITKDTTFYYEVVDSAGFISDRKRLFLDVTKPKAYVAFDEQPFLMTPGKTNTYQFIDQSENAVGWQWTISNGFQSTRKNPVIVFNEAGIFDVQLIAENFNGCKDTFQTTFETAWRAETPQISDREVCKNDQVSIKDELINEITIYSDSSTTQQIFKGTEFVTGPIQRDTAFYVRNETGDYPSETLKVTIQVIPLKARMQLRPDLNSDNDSLLVIAENTSLYEQQVVWLLGEKEISRENQIAINPMKLLENSLKLVAIAESACTDTAVFTGERSPDPSFDDFYVCIGQDLRIAAKNSSAVYYFKDADLNTLIGKGKSITIADFSEGMKVFAVNVSNILPSEIVEVPVYITDLSADFTLSQDTLNLAYQSSVTLTALSDAAVAWLWQFGGGQESTNKIVQASFSEPGIYTINLTVKDSLGCEESSKKEVVVYDDPLLGNSEELREYFSVFPNPANQFIHLKGEGNFSYESLKIIDTAGREIYSKVNDKPIQQAEVISTSELKPGAYYLVIKKGKKEAAFMFIIKR